MAGTSTSPRNELESLRFPYENQNELDQKTIDHFKLKRAEYIACT